MSMPITLETAVRPPLRRRATARVAVAVAAALIQLPPLRLARVLGVLSRGARPAVRQQALEARRAVVFVSVRCAGQGCLQRSVATILLCRLRPGSGPTGAPVCERCHFAPMPGSRPKASR